MNITFWLTIFTSVSFFFYGTSCLISGRMRSEFERYHLSNQRVLTGILELTGAAGLLIGLQFPMIGVLASGCLFLLMVLGALVRIKIGDSLAQTLPAVIYALVALYICISLLKTINNY